MGVLVPQPGIEPASPALESQLLTTGPSGKSVVFFLMAFFSLIIIQSLFFFSSLFKIFLLNGNVLVVGGSRTKYICF